MFYFRHFKRKQLPTLISLCYVFKPVNNRYIHANLDIGEPKRTSCFARPVCNPANICNRPGTPTTRGKGSFAEAIAAYSRTWLDISNRKGKTPHFLVNKQKSYSSLWISSNT